MMNLRTQTRLERVKEDLKKGERSADIVTRYSTEWKAEGRTVMKFIDMAQRELLVEMHEKKELIKNTRRKKITEAAEQDIICELEADIILSNIILGKTLVKKVYNTVNGTVEMEMPPDHATILKALDMYYKRMGSYKINKEEEEKEEKEDVMRVTGLYIPCEECPLNPACNEGCPEREIFLEAGGDKNLRTPCNSPEAKTYPDNNVIQPEEAAGLPESDRIDTKDEMKPDTVIKKYPADRHSKNLQQANNHEPEKRPVIPAANQVYMDREGRVHPYRKRVPPTNGGPRLKNYP